MENRIKEKIYILIEEESIKNKDRIEINLEKILKELKKSIKKEEDLNNIDIFIKVLSKYLK